MVTTNTKQWSIHEQLKQTAQRIKEARKIETLPKIKLTAIWRDGSKRVFLTESFSCRILRNPVQYYIKLDDGYTFACDAIEIEQQQ